MAATFVLVHGAWLGGWCWSRVADALRAFGHRVYTPTLTGLGERSHLLNDAITIDTFVRDVGNVLQWEDLRNVILVGHSFSGLTVTGVADVMPERIARLVYLDAFILQSGVSTFDTLPPATVEKMRAQAAGSAVSPPSPEHLGLTEAADVAFVAGRTTSQPLSTYASSLKLSRPVGGGLPVSYVRCTKPLYAPVQASADWARAQAGWEWSELETGHMAMVSAPHKVVEFLMGLAGRS